MISSALNFVLVAVLVYMAIGYDPQKAKSRFEAIVAKAKEMLGQ